MSIKGLLRTSVEIHRAAATMAESGEVTASYSLLNTTGSTIEIHGGNTVRNSNGEEVSIDAVAFFLAGTDIRPTGSSQLPDRIHANENWFEVSFVDTSPHRGAPLRVGLRLLTGEVN